MWSPRSRHRRILPLSGVSGGGLRPLVRHLFAREQRTIPRPGASFRVTVRKRRGPRIPMTDRHTPSQTTETQGGLIVPVSKVGLRRLVLTVVCCAPPPAAAGAPLRPMLPFESAAGETDTVTVQVKPLPEDGTDPWVGLTPEEPGVVRPSAFPLRRGPQAVPRVVVCHDGRLGRRSVQYVMQ